VNVGFQECDDAVAATGEADDGKCLYNAETEGSDEDVAIVLGIRDTSSASKSRMA
jgi:hypothetical protein